jgi:UDP-glucose 4-epimerase
LKILVTGGAGFIGSSIASELSKDSTNEVIALDNLYLGRESNLPKQVRFIRGSVMDYNLVLDAVKSCDYVFHDAAMSSSPMFKDDPRDGVDTNVIGFMNVMEAAKRNNIKKVIFASSSSLYNGHIAPFKESRPILPKTFYEASFYCREVLARTYYLENGLSSIGLRYFSVYGPNEKHKGKFANNISQFLWDMIQGKRPTIYGDGTQTRDFVFIKDVVHANILAMQSDKEFGIYNVGTGVQTSFNRMVEAINAQLGTNISPLYVNNPIRNYVQDTIADTSLAMSELGFRAEWSLEDGIRDLVASIKKESFSTTPAAA